MSGSGRMYHIVRLSLRLTFSNIVTHHAEDGSGIGSAIIAGKLLNSLLYLESVLTPSLAMTKKRKEDGLYPNY